MATSSIYKQVRIKDKATARRFMSAIERAEHNASAPATPKREVNEIKDAEEIRKLLMK